MPLPLSKNVKNFFDSSSLSFWPPMSRQRPLPPRPATSPTTIRENPQIIYDAVWADPSDPSKTYRNAASAILAELRRRAGITSLLGPFQPLTH
jgi:hypothetical protein